ncbi:MAG TPA: pyridoxal-phosphate dependent enzyme [Pseudomonadales bacterium]|nr:pyridoxal-phosphate dependent enzyme [Pseudomonadales bacterium]
MPEPVVQHLAEGLDVFFLDALHPGLGNKYYKLSANLASIKQKNIATVVSFGGAWSNHLLCLARLGKQAGLNTVGVVRGEQAAQLTAMLADARELGMRLVFVSRAAYRRKAGPELMQQLESEFGDFAVLPEGGSNELAVLGCMQIVSDLARHGVDYDALVLPVGTGGTLAGLVRGVDRPCDIFGISVLKGAYSLDDEVRCLIGAAMPEQVRWQLLHDHHGGGYARCSPALMQFVQMAERRWGVLLDPVYSGKALMATMQLRATGALSGKKTVFIHTGGLQGRRGFPALG